MSDFIPLSPVTDYRLTMSDGTVIECTTSLQDTLAFEGQKKRSLTAAVGQVPLTSDLIWLAWHAACRENKTELRQFARFSAQLVKIEANRAVNEPDYEFDADDEIDGGPEIAKVVGANPTAVDQFEG